MLPNPSLIFVLSGKGGVGKTLLSLLIADLFDLNGIPLDIVQIDDQQKLAMALGRAVVSIDITLLRKARKDPSFLTGAFTPLYTAIEAMPANGRSLLVDIGATQQHILLDYATLIELDADLREFGIQAFGLVPVVADPESIEQAARQIEALRRVFPSASPRLVLNERDGRFSQISSTSEAARLFRDRLQLLLGGIHQITMPKIEAGSWGYFERQHCRLIDVVGFDIATAMAMSGLPRPEAKIARGDIAAWFQIMEAEISAILPQLGGHHG